MASKYEYTKRSVQKRRQMLADMKDKPCSRCGDSFPHYCMDWHHEDPSEKKFEISKGSFRKSRKDLLDEIKKCSLLCANCHRIVEYELKLRVAQVSRTVS